MTLDIQEIKHCLPHRYPFLLIDKIIDLPDPKRIKSLKNVTINEPFFNGHFPQMAIMPGVLIIEAMAQTAAMLMLKNASDEERKNKLFVLGAVRDMRFIKPVFPGHQLVIEVEVIKLLSSAAMVSANASCDGQLVAAGNLSFGIINRKND